MNESSTEWSQHLAKHVIEVSVMQRSSSQLITNQTTPKVRLSACHLLQQYSFHAHIGLHSGMLSDSNHTHSLLNKLIGQCYLIALAEELALSAGIGGHT